MPKRSSTQRFFDKWSSRYDADLKANKYAVPEIFDQHILPFIKTHKHNEFLQILDIGIGTGISARSLKKLDNCYITGMDSSQKMLAQCRDHPQGNAADEFVHYDCNDTLWPIAGDQYDIVSAIGVLEYINDPRAFLRQMHQAAKQRGLLILSYETLDNLPYYKPGLISGVLYQDDMSATIRRRIKGLFSPFFYKKHLYDRSYIQTLCENEDLDILTTFKDIDTYQWPNQPAIKHDYAVLQKR